MKAKKELYRVVSVVNRSHAHEVEAVGVHVDMQSLLINMPRKVYMYEHMLSDQVLSGIEDNGNIIWVPQNERENSDVYKSPSSLINFK